MEVPTRRKIRGTSGCELLKAIEPVDPRAAEGLRRAAALGTVPISSKEIEALLEVEKRQAILDPYQRLLFEVKAMQKKGNFKSSQGDAIVQRIRDLSTPGWTTLDLSGFTIFDAFAILLARYLQSKTCKLERVNLSRTQIGINGVIAVAKSVNSELKELQFSQNPLDLSQFRRGTTGSNKQVKIVEQAHSHLDAAAIGTLLERIRSKVETIDLSYNALTGPRSTVFYGIGIIFQTLRRCPQLKVLRLASISLRSEGLVDLANTLPELKHLAVLDLSDNKVAFNSSGDSRSTGIEAFCNVLWQSKCLVEISLADNGLDYSSAEYISDMLAVNMTLKVLDLSGNPLSNAGVVGLANGLKKNASLALINLSRCAVGDEGIEAISSSLKLSNQTLRTIDLSENPDIKSNGYRTLVKCLSANRTIREVFLPVSSKYAKYAKRISDLLEVNSLLHLLIDVQGTQRAAEPITLSEDQCTNMIRKLHELCEADLSIISSSPSLATILSNIDRSLPSEVTSSIGHYATSEQLEPLKKILWIWDCNSRKDARDQRNRATKHKTGCFNPDAENNVDDDEDIWDYPLF